ncbi:MAG: hypothetical protein AAF616_06605 [Bacteroidota bacterium]
MSLFSFKKKNDGIKLAKSESGDWMVKKGFSILYIGTREKCELFMKQTLSLQ